jgi:hypothetical protein
MATTHERNGARRRQRRWQTPGADEAVRLLQLGRRAFDPANNRRPPRAAKPQLEGQLALELPARREEDGGAA